MEFLMDQHWESHLDLPIVKYLAWIKASYSDLLMVNYLALHLEQQMLLQMDPLMVMINKNLRVTCFELDLYKKLVLHLVLLMVP